MANLGRLEFLGCAASFLGQDSTLKNLTSAGNIRSDGRTFYSMEACQATLALKGGQVSFLNAQPHGSAGVPKDSQFKTNTAPAYLLCPASNLTNSTSY